MTERKTAISRRFIACTQSTGRVGKSTLAEGIITWLHFAQVEFAAIDADSQHQTLLHRYPDEVGAFDATKTLDDFARSYRLVVVRKNISVQKGEAILFEDIKYR
jgi:cellulose biosynthesis protein BcsQ